MSDITLSAKQKAKINRALKSLESVRSEVEQANPGADINWYLEDTANLHLMDGDSHTDQGANQTGVIERFEMSYASGGGW